MESLVALLLIAAVIYFLLHPFKVIGTFFRLIGAFALLVIVLVILGLILGGE